MGRMVKPVENIAMQQTPPPESALSLTRRVAAGDETAARVLVSRLMNRVYRTCEYLANGSDGADLAQVALMEIVRSAGGFREESSLEYWADRITVRCAAKVFAKRDRRRRIRDAFFVPSPVQADLERQAALGQVRARLQHHLSALPEKQRIVVVLHYLHEYDVPEISALLDERTNTVRSRLSRGLSRLRQRILADRGLKEWIREGKG